MLWYFVVFIYIYIYIIQTSIKLWYFVMYIYIYIYKIQTNIKAVVLCGVLGTSGRGFLFSNVIQ